MLDKKCFSDEPHEFEVISDGFFLPDSTAVYCTIMCKQCAMVCIIEAVPEAAQSLGAEVQ